MGDLPWPQSDHLPRFSSRHPPCRRRTTAREIALAMASAVGGSNPLAEIMPSQRTTARNNVELECQLAFGSKGPATNADPSNRPSPPCVCPCIALHLTTPRPDPIYCYRLATLNIAHLPYLGKSIPTITLTVEEYYHRYVVVVEITTMAVFGVYGLLSPKHLHVLFPHR